MNSALGRRLARDAAEIVRGDAGTPVDLDHVTRAWGIRVIVSDRRHPSAEAIYARRRGIPTVTVFPRRAHLAGGATTPRERFTLAHEIGHWAFDAVVGADPRRMTTDERDEERWCDMFASYLLVPDAAVTDGPHGDQLRDPRTLLDSCVALADRCQVSRHVAAQRQLELGVSGLVGVLRREGTGWCWQWATGLTRREAERVRADAAALEPGSGRTVDIIQDALRVFAREENATLAVAAVRTKHADGSRRRRGALDSS